jgi:hypothetical protein
MRLLALQCRPSIYFKNLPKHQAIIDSIRAGKTNQKIIGVITIKSTANIPDTNKPISGSTTNSIRDRTAAMTHIAKSESAATAKGLSTFLVFMISCISKFLLCIANALIMGKKLLAKMLRNENSQLFFVLLISLLAEVMHRAIADTLSL